jgi:hypothetical protein
VPERDFAVVALSNASPNGTTFNQTVIRWALQNYLGMIDLDLESLPYDEERAQEVVGSYGNDYMILTIRDDGMERLSLSTPGYVPKFVPRQKANLVLTSLRPTWDYWAEARMSSSSRVAI